MFDVAIIGAGVVGCSIARELARYKLDVCVLEAKSDVAMGSSGANSGIVHAGYDCKPGTLMAYLNVKGNVMYDDIARELDVPFKRNGSLVLAFTDEDVQTLHRLLDQGIKNGVTRLKILSAKEVLDMEPNLNPSIKAALWAPAGGITSPFEVTIAMAENAADNGVQFYLGHQVLSIQRCGDSKFHIETSKGAFISRYVINAAGINSDLVSQMVGDHSFSIYPRKGEYCLYDKKWGNLVNSTIFQPPSRLGKGVLVTPTVDGNLLIGPNAVDINDRDDVDTTDEGLGFVYQKALESVPLLPRTDVITQFAGLRAIADGEDFIIRPSHIVEGFVHVAGICSPGLSAAPAIAKYVVDILNGIMQRNSHKLEPKKDFNPHRRGISRFSDADWHTREELIKKDSRFGRIVCRCEMVTEGEIVEALHRNPPALTLDAIKRRTRAGMGRCQGGFCTPRIMEIMERELDIPMEQITKKGGRSRLVLGRIKDFLEGDGEC
ncbi:glycerol-3-phosphate dehydrogenase [Caldicoprobacter guelmensis]|uniref:NAD(P)/FAD-dependent oxidoreductase n=1 Tax=Caldicoprobacter guelmensis TaxID=1170224 RepID=UPI001957B37D|nr:NAD(P)/FAD-dependent oxidoreductase [Caldicoprobacter guelmensis]MBM7581790.1 glycerol-3-phosphate dehydrogenase [Caldicoprobacter guelmensis]